MPQASPAVLPKALARARRLLADHGEVPRGLGLPEPVARSWQRSLAAGLTPAAPAADAHLDPAGFAQAAERRGTLARIARPVIEALHAEIRGSGSLLLLADDRGVVLDALGDADFAGRAARVALQPGACWAEKARGTNAVGTALAEAAPAVVQGAEHFLDCNAFLACAAAPIAAPDGALLGVLDLSCDARLYHPHSHALVRGAARQIEARLFEAKHARNLRLRLHATREGIGTPSEGLLALAEDGRLLGANAAAIALLGLAPNALGGKRLCDLLPLGLADLLDWERRRPGEPLPARTAGGPLHLRLEAPPARAVHPVAPPPASDALAAIDTGDPTLRTAIAQTRRVLGRPIALLLLGETGVGKEVFARAAHASGPRRAGPFVAINCAALPETLIEGELFGHAAGAFTGARRQGAPGRIREAHGGTLFLDEIGEMPLAMQARLLRVLEERTVTPLGGRAVAVDFALVSATNRDLRAEVAAGRFRADLYYRLNGLALRLPPLRDRQDFPALLARLLDQALPGHAPALAPSLAAAFAAHRWPGNLRQLATALRTAALMLEPGETLLDWHHLPADLLAELKGDAVLPMAADSASLRAISDAAIAAAVTAARGNMTEAARRLGISRNTLYRRLAAQRPAVAAAQHMDWRSP